MVITVYSTPFCAPCERLKQYLKNEGIAFDSKDLMMDPEAAELLEARGIRTSPVLEVDGEFYAGSDLAADKLPKLLGVEK